jgi:hypothetical protein
MTPFEHGYWHTMKCAGYATAEKQAFRQAIGDFGSKAMESFRALRELPSAHRGIGEAEEQAGRLMAQSKAKSREAGEALIPRQDPDVTRNIRPPTAANQNVATQVSRQNRQTSGQALSREAQDLSDDAHFLRNKAQSRWDETKRQAMPAGVAAVAAPVVGLGAAGAFGAGDADTTSNQMKNFSNRNLGTNFSTQSRFGSMFG